MGSAPKWESMPRSSWEKNSRLRIAFPKRSWIESRKTGKATGYSHVGESITRFNEIVAYGLNYAQPRSLCLLQDAPILFLLPVVPACYFAPGSEPDAFMRAYVVQGV